MCFSISKRTVSTHQLKDRTGSIVTSWLATGLITNGSPNLSELSNQNPSYNVFCQLEILKRKLSLQLGDGGWGAHGLHQLSQLVGFIWWTAWHRHVAKCSGDALNQRWHASLRHQNGCLRTKGMHGGSIKCKRVAKAAGGKRSPAFSTWFIKLESASPFWSTWRPKCKRFLMNEQHAEQLSCTVGYIRFRVSHPTHASRSSWNQDPKQNIPGCPKHARTISNFPTLPAPSPRLPWIFQHTQLPIEALGSWLCWRGRACLSCKASNIKRRISYQCYCCWCFKWIWPLPLVLQPMRALKTNAPWLFCLSRLSNFISNQRAFEEAQNVRQAWCIYYSLPPMFPLSLTKHGNPKVPASKKQFEGFWDALHQRFSPKKPAFIRSGEGVEAISSVSECILQRFWSRRLIEIHSKTWSD